MKIVATAILMSLATLTMAQNEDPMQQRQRKGAQSIPQNAEDLASQLEISPELADKTWAIYSEYNALKQANYEKRKREIDERRANKDERTDADIEKMFYDNLKSQREALDMDEEYFKKFNEILPARKTMTLMRQIRMAKHQDRNRAREGMNSAPNKVDESK